MFLTDKEKAILKAGCDSNYENFCYAQTWCFDVIEKSKIEAKMARGVISSLIKKNLVTVLDEEGRGNSDDMSIYATPAGVNECNKLGYND